MLEIRKKMKGKAMEKGEKKRKYFNNESKHPNRVHKKEERKQKKGNVNLS